MEKLSSLGTEKFKSKFKHTGNFYIKNLRHSDNTEVMNSVNAINEAINKSKKITFTSQLQADITSIIFHITELTKLRMYQLLMKIQFQRAIVDWFGTGQNYKILQIQDNRFLIEVKINYTAMRFWAMQFSEYVEIVNPTNLRED